MEHQHHHKPNEIPVRGVDLSEKGMDSTHAQTTLNRRMYVQFLAFTDVTDVALLQNVLDDAGIDAVLYLDLSDSRGVGLVTMHEDPEFFVSTLRNVLSTPPFLSLTPKHHLTMTGRTYAIGYENDLEETLFTRPKNRILDPELSWVIWYPLRRSGAFEQLSVEDQRAMLKEHGSIGHQFGTAKLAYDIRLDCHGLDMNDNDFVIGIIGKELTPLSKVVEHMRKTKQTSVYLEKLGPFFVGKVYWQSALHHATAIKKS